MAAGFSTSQSLRPAATHSEMGKRQRLEVQVVQPEADKQLPFVAYFATGQPQTASSQASYAAYEHSGRPGNKLLVASQVRVRAWRC